MPTPSPGRTELGGVRGFHHGRRHPLPYLWARQHDSGEQEGRKSRPTAVGVRLSTASGDRLILLAITTRMPDAGRHAIEIPETEKRRAGLDTARRQWIILDEYNEDVVEDSFYLHPDSQIGRFSKAFFLPVMHEFIRLRKETRRISRR